MKVLFTSDLQLEAGLSLGYGEFGPGSRFQDQRENLDRIANLAVAQGVGLVCVNGDVFERSKPSPWAILAFQSFVRALTTSGIKVLVILGNHDVRSAALPPALSIFHEAGVEVALAPSIWPLDDIVVAALPWSPTSRLIAGTPDAARDDIHQTAAEALVHGAHVLGARCRDEFADKTPILIGHWAISGASLPTGLDTSHLREPVIPIEGLSGAGFAVVAFGHIHMAQVITKSPSPVFYCGSPMVMNWGEALVPHGVWIFDAAGAGALKFHPVEDRRFVTVGGSSEPWDDTFCLPAMIEGGVEGALVRIAYTCSEEQGRSIDQAALRRLYHEAGAHKVFVKPTVLREVRARATEAHAEGLTEVDGLELWLSSQDVAAADAGALRALHGEYVARVA